MITVRVAKKITEAQDVAVFELADANGADLPPFSAGSHIDVEIKPGLLRQYSLCNNPRERNRYVIGVLKEPAGRGGSAAMHALTEGQQLLISEPRNHFELEGSATKTLLFAGGIGITPLLCMAERLAAIGADFQMHYATRSRERMAFYDRILAAGFRDKVQLHFDDGDAAQRLDLQQALGAAKPGVHVYVCGPSGFIDAVLKAAAAQGYGEAEVHREYFNADAAQTFAAAGAFQVKLASSGQVFDIPPDVTILEVLRTNGIQVPTSCEQGVCGTCLTRVLEGIPEHRDVYLTNKERSKNNVFTPCCSRSKTPLLVIDM